jgi:hypothetical protein
VARYLKVSLPMLFEAGTMRDLSLSIITRERTAVLARQALAVTAYRLRKPQSLLIPADDPCFLPSVQMSQLREETV